MHVEGSRQIFRAAPLLYAALFVFTLAFYAWGDSYAMWTRWALWFAALPMA